MISRFVDDSYIISWLRRMGKWNEEKTERRIGLSRDQHIEESRDISIGMSMRTTE